MLMLFMTCNLNTAITTASKLVYSNSYWKTVFMKQMKVKLTAGPTQFKAV